ncbi:MAG: Arginine-tRNA ligase [Parcubacteria group bacterium Gr01-1014_46]|nr:MAG: Arginine-tRNA ligase [Parcubacteria group bacterium Gr01-1014_46]
MKEILEKEIEKILIDLGVKDPNVAVTPSVYLDKGDYTTSVAMVHAKELSKKPLDLAEEIKEELESKDKIRSKELSNISKIEIVQPGFMNFFFTPEYFANSLSSKIENKIFSGQKIIIEYTDPNPFKEFHIGHLMPNVIGESISRILESNGAEIKRANYQGDVGLHVAKAVWSMKNGTDLMSAYAEGHKAYEEDESAKKEIIEINKKIYDKSDTEINDLYEAGRQKSLLYFEVMYKILGTKFDHYFFESEVADFGKETVEKNIGTVFEKSEGAVIFKGENYDKKLHTRVFITKEGLPTYEAKELGLSKIKYDAYPYDVSIVVTGNEINEYFKVLLKAMSLVFPELAEKTKHISHGMLKLPEGKMSSRTGNVITAESLINQVTEKVLEKMKDGEIAESEKSIIAENVALGAIKYTVLRSAIGGDIVFDFDKSISFEGDSGPYLQYATVRANSILKKASPKSDFGLPEGWVTTNLERLIERFPSVVERAGVEYVPHYITTYLTELAGEFNSFYAVHKIIDETDPTSSYRLALTEAFVQVMTNGLNLLGIKIPDRM